MIVNSQPISEPPSTKTLLKLHWKQLLSGTLLGSGGLGYCLFLHLKEYPKWTFLPLIAGSIGITLMNSAIMEIFETPSERSEDSSSHISLESLIPLNDVCTTDSKNTLDHLTLLYEDLTDVYLNVNNNSVIMISKIQCEECKKLARNVYNEMMGKEYQVPESDTNVRIDLLHMEKHDKESAVSSLQYNADIYEVESAFRNYIYKLFGEVEKLINHSMNPALPRGDPKVLDMTEEEQDGYKFPSGKQMSPQSRLIVSKMTALIYKLRFAFEKSVDQFITSFREAGKREIEGEKFTRLQGIIQVLEKEEALNLEERGMQTKETGSSRKRTLQMEPAKDPSLSPVDEPSLEELEDIDEVDVFSESFSSQLDEEETKSIRSEIGDMVKELKRRDARMSRSESEH